MYIIDYVLPRVSRFAFTRSTLQREWLKGNPAYAISVSFVPRFRPVVFFPPTIFFHHLGSLAALSISIIKGGSRRAAFRVKSIEAVRLALIEIKSDTASRNCQIREPDVIGSLQLSIRSSIDTARWFLRGVPRRELKVIEEPQQCQETFPHWCHFTLCSPIFSPASRFICAIPFYEYLSSGRYYRNRLGAGNNREIQASLLAWSKFLISVPRFSRLNLKPDGIEKFRDRVRRLASLESEM